jgi:hypothetical protein
MRTLPTLLCLFAVLGRLYGQNLGNVADERLDFSQAGAKPVRLEPNLPVLIAEKTAMERDAAASLQQYIDRIAAYPAAPSGFRGIVEIPPGNWPIAAPLRISRSGIVLRGPKNSPRPARLIKTGGGGAAVIYIAPDPARTSLGTSVREAKISREGARMNSSRLTVLDSSWMKVGDRVVVTFPSTPEWLDTINNSERPDRKWTAGRADRRYYRTIIGLEANAVSLDAPLYSSYRSAEVAATIASDLQERVQDVIVEDLVVELSDSGDPRPVASPTRVGIGIASGENVMLRRVTINRSLLAGIEVSKHSRRISLVDCTIGPPLKTDEIGRGYGIRLKNAQLVLCDRCKVEGARMAYVCSGGTFDSGIVFNRCRSSETKVAAYASTGHWAHGILVQECADDTRGIGPLIKFEKTAATKETEGGWTFVDLTVLNSQLNCAPPTDQPPFGAIRVISSDKLLYPVQDL